MNQCSQIHDNADVMNSLIRDTHSNVWYHKNSDVDSNDTTTSSVYTNTTAITTATAVTAHVTTPSSETHPENTSVSHGEHVAHNFSCVSALAQAASLHSVARFSGYGEKDYTLRQRAQALTALSGKAANPHGSSASQRASEEVGRRPTVNCTGETPLSFEFVPGTSFPGKTERMNYPFTDLVTREDGEQPCVMSYKTKNITTNGCNSSSSSSRTRANSSRQDEAHPDNGTHNSASSTPPTTATPFSAAQPLALFHDPLWGSEEELDVICRTTSASETEAPPPHVNQSRNSVVTLVSVAGAATPSEAMATRSATQGQQHQRRTKEQSKVSPIHLFKSTNAKAKPTNVHTAGMTGAPTQSHSDGCTSELGATGSGATAMACTQGTTASNSTATDRTPPSAKQTRAPSGSQQTTPALMSSTNHTAHGSVMLPPSAVLGMAPPTVAIAPYTKDYNHVMYQYMNAQHQQQQHQHFQQQQFQLQQQMMQQQLLQSSVPPLMSTNSPPMYAPQTMQNPAVPYASVPYPVQSTLYSTPLLQNPMLNTVNTPTMVNMPGPVTAANMADQYNTPPVPIQYMPAQQMPFAGGVGVYPNVMLSYQPGDTPYYTVNSAMAPVIPVKTAAYTN